jgi:hypothetical protein
MTDPLVVPKFESKISAVARSVAVERAVNQDLGMVPTCVNNSNGRHQPWNAHKQSAAI